MNMLINGEWVEAKSKEVIEVYNPSTHELLDTVPRGKKEDIQVAVTHAKNGFLINRSIPAKDRYAYLLKAGNLQFLLQRFSI